MDYLNIKFIFIDYTVYKANKNFVTPLKTISYITIFYNG